MTDLEELYFDAIQPRNLIKHIPDLREWLSLATCKKDLECTLRAFEADELYEECCVIRDYLKIYFAD